MRYKNTFVQGEIRRNDGKRELTNLVLVTLNLIATLNIAIEENSDK
jgi:hypothetical protein